MRIRRVAIVAAAAVVSMGISAQVPAADPLERLAPLDDAGLNDIRAGAGFSAWSSSISLSNLLLPSHQGSAAFENAFRQLVRIGVSEIRSGVRQAGEIITGYPYPNILPPTGL
jgi:hypothetical protein